MTSGIKCKNVPQEHQLLWYYGAIKLKMAVFCDVTPFTLIETHRRFIDTYCLSHQGHASHPYALHSELVKSRP